MPHVEVIRQFEKPTKEFIAIANQIGYEAWLNRFSYRGEPAVRRNFDPAHPEKLRRKMRAEIYSGHFVGTVILVGPTERTAKPVGVAWGSDNMPGNGFARAIKHLRGQQPDAIVSQINVLPSHQGDGFGTMLMGSYLSNFRASQQPTAYIFEENHLSMQWFREKLGYRPVPLPAAQPVDGYFGAEQPPVLLQRLEALSVADVRERIAQLN